MKHTSNTTKSATSSKQSNSTKSPENGIAPSDPMNRIEFRDGGKRDDGDRCINYGLFCPAAMRALATTFKEGEIKYGSRNWEKGIPTENYIDHALEHIFNAMSAQTTRITELSHALWNIAAAIHNETGCVHHVWED